MAAGTFSMGPKVTRLPSFYLCDREVGVDKFRQFVDEQKSLDVTSDDWPEHDARISPDGHYPVQNVSWIDAIRFCNWLSKADGLEPYYKPRRDSQVAWDFVHDSNGYRLPTEAEWEYACRAGTATNFSCGNELFVLANYAVYLTEHTQPAASKLPNGWGLFDMHGNVWEWCQDWFNPLEGPNGRLIGVDRVLRGGPFWEVSQKVESTICIGQPPSRHGLDFGFRVARTCPEAK